MSSVGTPRSSRFESLDLWRGLLCVYIVFEHAGVLLWRGAGEASGVDGWLRQALVTPLTWHVGTPLFFVISGFCVLNSIDSHRRRGVAATTFLGRRFSRIFPSYWAALLFFMIVVGGLDRLGLESWHRNGLTHELSSVSEVTPAQWIGNLTLTETWRPHIAGEHEHVFTRIAWSLCFQEQFYVVCFLLLFLFRKHFHRALAILTAVIFAAVITLNDVGMSGALKGIFPVRWHHFAAGLAVYWCLRQETPKWARLGLIGSLCLMAGQGIRFGDNQSLAAALFALSLVFVSRFDASIARLRLLAPLRACGVRSYSIYLIHLPVCIVVLNTLDVWGLQSFWVRALVVVPVAVGGSLAASWVFHELVDTPVANASRGRAKRSAERLAVGVS